MYERFASFLQTSNLAELLDGMSFLAGGPVLITDPRGRLLCLPTCHPDFCPLLGEGSTCPVVQRMRECADSPRRSPVLVRFHGVRHAVSSIQYRGCVLGFAIAEERRCQGPQSSSPQRGEGLRVVASLLATLIERMLAWRDAHTAPHPLGANGGDPPQEREVEVLTTCPRESTRGLLGEAILAGRLTPQGVARLRREFGLTWREVEVFVRYYLFPHADALQNGNLRKAVAQHLGVTEGTLRVYLNTVRGKLGLQSRRGSLGVLVWAREAGIVPPGMSFS